MASDKGSDKASTAASSGAIAQLLIAIGGQTKRVAAAALSGALSAVAAFQVLTPPDLTAGAAAVCLARPAAGCPPLGGTAGVPSPVPDNPSLRASLDPQTCRVAPSQVGQAAVPEGNSWTTLSVNTGKTCLLPLRHTAPTHVAVARASPIGSPAVGLCTGLASTIFYLFSTGFSLQC